MNLVDNKEVVTMVTQWESYTLDFNMSINPDEGSLIKRENKLLKIQYTNDIVRGYLRFESHPIHLFKSIKNPTKVQKLT